MDTSVNIETYTLQIPHSDVRLLSSLVKKMGWVKKKVQTKKRSRKSGLSLALEDVEKGNLKSFSSVDSLMDYLHT